MKRPNLFKILMTSLVLVGATLACSGQNDGGLSVEGALGAGAKPGKKGHQAGGAGGATGGTPTAGAGGSGGGANCSYTQGFWKNHAAAWPVNELTLGNVRYSKEQLLEIFRTPVKGNGLVSLAHQLIAAKLNVASGAIPGSVAATIADADAKIGALTVPPVGDGWLAPADTSALNDLLTNFNEGQTGPGHCDKIPPGAGGVAGSGGGTASGGRDGAGGRDNCPPDAERCGGNRTCTVGTCVNDCCVIVP